MTRTYLLAFLTALCTLASASAAPPPAVTYESMLNLYFDDESGLLSVRDVDLVFAPEGEIKAAVAVTDSTNTVVKSYAFYPEPRWREGVFARLSEVGPADVTLSEPGLYNIIFLVDGTPISRMPVLLEQTSEGDDPFNPEKTYRFAGLWPVFANLTMNTWNDDPFPQLNLWLGGKDLPEGETKDRYQAVLKKEGEVIAHSKTTQGYFNEGHYEEDEISLYHPHTKREIPNAMPFMLSDWTKEDGAYDLEIVRGSDEAVIRSFAVTVEGGTIAPLENSAIDFEPHIDYVAPRVKKKGSNRYEFVEAIWLRSE